MILFIKHIDIEGPGTLGEFFEKQSSWQVKTIEMDKGESLPPLSGCSAVISLGGPMNVYESDKYPFLDIEKDFLREAIRKETPVLGICLGAQLLASAASAGVRKADEKEVGWYKVGLTAEGTQDMLFDGLQNDLDVFQWHEDTFDIPAGGARLAGSGVCRNQAFRVGKNAYGLQFHLEVTPEMIESWVERYMDNSSASPQTQDLLLKSYKMKGPLEKQADTVYLNFARIIAAAGKKRAG